MRVVRLLPLQTRTLLYPGLSLELVHVADAAIDAHVPPLKASKGELTLKNEVFADTMQASIGLPKCCCVSRLHVLFLWR